MKYYVSTNAQPTGEHEVHNESCPFLPKPENRVYLGDFSTCQDAVAKASSYYSNVDGCKVCSPSCHTK
ncbi:hypothetical protein HNQ91_001773 [Filimonas zeae]|nr:hypothetical protein [Filimonas zeae]